MFFIVLVFIGAKSPIWGYDEYVSVISHLELEDQRFLNIYDEYFPSLFPRYISDIILTIFIIPIRWTYAIGISPIYSISRVFDIEWTYLRLIFLAFHSFFSLIGLKLIYKVFHNNFESKFLLLIFTTLLFFSFPFLYWTSTLSSYSYHLFCFGMILFNETTDTSVGQKFLCKKSYRRSIIQLFNYQYIPIVFISGLYNLFKYKKTFFTTKKYKEWILPGIISIITLFFLILRSILTNKHSNPTDSALANKDKFDIWSNTSGFFDLIEFFMSRIYDITAYFFQIENYHMLLSNRFTALNLFWAIVLLLIFAVFLIFLLSVKSKVVNFLLLIITTNIIFYFFGIYPFTPSRHSLISFLPFISLVSILIYLSLKNIKIKLIYTTIALILFVFSLFNLNKSYNIESFPLKKEFLLSTLSSYSVDRLVLVPCDQEPLFFMRDINKYKPLYKCGPKVIEVLNKGFYRFGVYSKNKVSYDSVVNAIKPFLKNNNVNFIFINQIVQKPIIEYDNPGNVIHTITIVDVKI
jgi:hypothetical protein